jgi:branched-chain amino acid transport system ATP-binding protein
MGARISPPAKSERTRSSQNESAERNAPALLATDGLSIRFGGHAAVDGVSCRFPQGTLTAIVGPNGAGKTTYFNLISGQLRASSGEVWLNGERITHLPPSARAQRGIGRAFQLTNLFPNLTVLENVRLAIQARSKLGFSMLRLADDATDIVEQACAVLARVRLEHRADIAAAALSHGDQRKLEVAILLAMQPRIFMFDEPTAGMSVDEVPVLLDLIEAIKAERQHTILLVEHKMDVVRRLADRIVVLHQGRLVAEGDPASVVNLPIVREAYLGRAALP